MTVMMADNEVETQRELLDLLDQIEVLLADVRDVVIDSDPEMHKLVRKAENGVE